MIKVAATTNFALIGLLGEVGRRFSTELTSHFGNTGIPEVVLCSGSVNFVIEIYFSSKAKQEEAYCKSTFPRPQRNARKWVRGTASLVRGLRLLPSAGGRGLVEGVVVKVLIHVYIQDYSFAIYWN